MRMPVHLAMAMAHAFLLLLLLPALMNPANAGKYNTSAGIVPGKINVHLVPHTHDDVGWLKTVDQYYIGSNNSIQEAGVQYILDAVFTSLTSNPDRKFVYVEQAFFQRWWRQQTHEVQSTVKELVHSGKLELINGGWCMHDEAATHYIDMIEQTTLGHKYIKKQFGVTPRIGWQIDPFGHSAVQAYLLGAELGFDALFFARIDYQDRIKRSKDKSLEVIWQGSRTLGSDAQIFTSIFPIHYGPPDGFSYEETDEIPVQDDPSLFDFNLEERVNSFVAAAQKQAALTRTDHVMWTMGNDFKYATAAKWFVQMDKLIHYVNIDGRVNALYSTPSIYLDAKHAANESWPLKTDDFFPYADDGNSYWTGYFTSRPAFKGYARALSSYLQVARQLEFLAGRKKSPSTDSLWDAISIVQHHDGVSGTEKQHVTNDYAKRLAIGAAESDLVIKSALKSLTSKSFAFKKREQTSITSESQFVQCPLLNVSFCPSTESTTSAGKTFVVTVYNPLGWEREDYIRIPVNSQELLVTDASGKSVPSQLVPLSEATKRIRPYYVRANLGVSSGDAPDYWLYFKSSVPPLGFSRYHVSAANQTDSAVVSKVTNSNETSSIDIGFNSKLTFSSATGQLTRIVNSKSGTETPVQQSYYWYAGYAGDGQHSGAYIFLPDGETAKPLAESVPLTVIRGPLVEEVHQEFAPWIHQVFRVYKDVEHAEVEFVIGPIPTEDGIGKEVITRYTTGIPSNKIFYTDSNGRDFIKRVRDFRTDWSLQVAQPVAGNYYPVNLGIYLKDNQTAFSILVDRSVGGGSIVDGQLEVMLHRRLLVDDGRGVGEALDEVVCIPEGNSSNCAGLTIQGISYLNVNPVDKAARWRRYQGQKALFPVQLFFGSKETMGSKVNSFTSVASGYALPENVALITLQELEDGNVLLRLAHLYEADEDEELSKAATVDLSLLFAGRKIQNATELSLSANQEKSKIKPLQWKLEVAGKSRISPRGGPFDTKNLKVELGPMEIRTFQLQFA